MSDVVAPPVLTVAQDFSKGRIALQAYNPRLSAASLARLHKANSRTLVFSIVWVVGVACLIGPALNVATLLWDESGIGVVMVAVALLWACTAIVAIRPKAAVRRELKQMPNGHMHEADRSIQRHVSFHLDGEKRALFEDVAVAVNHHGPGARDVAWEFLGHLQSGVDPKSAAAWLLGQLQDRGAVLSAEQAEAARTQRQAGSLAPAPLPPGQAALQRWFIPCVLGGFALLVWVMKSGS